MSRSLNKVMLIGNVGTEPEIRQSAGGIKIAKVSLATNRVFNDRAGQRQEKTEWHRLTLFERLAELAEQYVHKGDRIYVEGRIEYSQTEEPGGTGTRYWTDIVVQELVLLGQGGGGQAGQGGQGAGAERSAPSSRPEQQQRTRPQAPAAPFDNEDDDLPF